MARSNWRARFCACCDNGTVREARSLIDKQIRPICQECKAQACEPMIVVLVATASLDWERLPAATRRRIHVIENGEYVSAHDWAMRRMADAILAKSEEEDADEITVKGIVGRMKTIVTGFVPDER